MMWPRFMNHTATLIAAAALAESSVLTNRSLANPDNDPARGGRGWKMVSLDLDITVSPVERKFVYDGVLKTRLEGLDISYGPTLLMNIRRSDDQLGIDFESVSSPGATTEIVQELISGRIRAASVQFAEPKNRGDTVNVDFRCATVAPVGQLIVDKVAAVASWTAMWHPWTILPTEGELEWNAGASSAPGRTTLRLPHDWIGIVDGELVERIQTDAGSVERWETPDGIARSFAAGPYDVTTHIVGRRPVRVYLLPGEKAVTRQQLATSVGRSIAAQEARFGAFPFPGAYSIVEFPRIAAQSFGAASQQTFILAQPPAFDFEHGNLRLWAHESAHAWWANTVGTAGRGGKWAGEALAALGALIAVEAIDGRDAMLEMLDFGHEGMDPYYSAAGYFSLMRQGQDVPIATMGSAGASHALANSKGVWIYHMLRDRLGDEQFFAVLRGLIAEFTHRDMRAEDIRARFAAAAEVDLEVFFAQWLDRVGAPVFDLDWHATVDRGGVLVALAQTQGGEPFESELDVAVICANGTTVVERVEIRETSHVFQIETPTRPVCVRLDPDRKLLMWRSEYGPRPGNEIVRAQDIVPKEIVDAIVGVYEFRGMEKKIRVFERDGAIYVQPEDWASVRILHQGGGIFHLDAPGEPMITEFDLSVSPSPILKSIEGKAGVYIADRVEVPGAYQDSPKPKGSHEP